MTATGTEHIPHIWFLIGKFDISARIFVLNFRPMKCLTPPLFYEVSVPSKETERSAF